MKHIRGLINFMPSSGKNALTVPCDNRDRLCQGGSEFAKVELIGCFSNRSLAPVLESLLQAVGVA